MPAGRHKPIEPPSPDTTARIARKGGGASAVDSKGSVFMRLGFAQDRDGKYNNNLSRVKKTISNPLRRPLAGKSNSRTVQKKIAEFAKVTDKKEDSSKVRSAAVVVPKSDRDALKADHDNSPHPEREALVKRKVELTKRLKEIDGMEGKKGGGLKAKAKKAADSSSGSGSSSSDSSSGSDSDSSSSSDTSGSAKVDSSKTGKKVKKPKARRVSGSKRKSGSGPRSMISRSPLKKKRSDAADTSKGRHRKNRSSSNRISTVVGARDLPNSEVTADSSNPKSRTDRKRRNSPGNPGKRRGSSRSGDRQRGGYGSVGNDKGGGIGTAWAVDERDSKRSRRSSRDRFGTAGGDIDSSFGRHQDVDEEGDGGGFEAVRDAGKKSSSVFDNQILREQQMMGGSGSTGHTRKTDSRKSPRRLDRYPGTSAISSRDDRELKKSDQQQSSFAGTDRSHARDDSRRNRGLGEKGSVGRDGDLSGKDGHRRYNDRESSRERNRAGDDIVGSRTSPSVPKSYRIQHQQPTPERGNESKFNRHSQESKLPASYERHRNRTPPPPASNLSDQYDHAGHGRLRSSEKAHREDRSTGDKERTRGRERARGLKDSSDRNDDGRSLHAIGRYGSDDQLNSSRSRRAADLDKGPGYPRYPRDRSVDRGYSDNLGGSLALVRTDSRMSLYGSGRHNDTAADVASMRLSPRGGMNHDSYLANRPARRSRNASPLQSATYVGAATDAGFHNDLKSFRTDDDHRRSSRNRRRDAPLGLASDERRRSRSPRGSSGNGRSRNKGSNRSGSIEGQMLPVKTDPFYDCTAASPRQSRAGNSVENLHSIKQIANEDTLRAARDPRDSGASGELHSSRLSSRRHRQGRSAEYDSGDNGTSGFRDAPVTRHVDDRNASRRQDDRQRRGKERQGEQEDGGDADRGHRERGWPNEDSSLAQSPRKGRSRPVSPATVRSETDEGEIIDSTDTPGSSLMPPLGEQRSYRRSEDPIVGRNVDEPGRSSRRDFDGGDQKRRRDSREKLINYPDVDDPRLSPGASQKDSKLSTKDRYLSPGRQTGPGSRSSRHRRRLEGGDKESFVDVSVDSLGMYVSSQQSGIIASIDSAISPGSGSSRGRRDEKIASGGLRSVGRGSSHERDYHSGRAELKSPGVISDSTGHSGGARNSSSSLRSRGIDDRIEKSSGVPDKFVPTSRGPLSPAEERYRESEEHFRERYGEALVDPRVFGAEGFSSRQSDIPPIGNAPPSLLDLTLPAVITGDRERYNEYRLNDLPPEEREQLRELHNRYEREGVLPPREPPVASFLADGSRKDYTNESKYSTGIEISRKLTAAILSRPSRSPSRGGHRDEAIASVDATVPPERRGRSRSSGTESSTSRRYSRRGRGLGSGERNEDRDRKHLDSVALTGDSHDRSRNGRERRVSRDRSRHRKDEKHREKFKKEDHRNAGFGEISVRSPNRGYSTASRGPNDSGRRVESNQSYDRSRPDDRNDLSRYGKPPEEDFQYTTRTSRPTDQQVAGRGGCLNSRSDYHSTAVSGSSRDLDSYPSHHHATSTSSRGASGGSRLPGTGYHESRESAAAIIPAPQHRVDEVLGGVRAPMDRYGVSADSVLVTPAPPPSIPIVVEHSGGYDRDRQSGASSFVSHFEKRVRTVGDMIRDQDYDDFIPKVSKPSDKNESWMRDSGRSGYQRDARDDVSRDKYRQTVRSNVSDGSHKQITKQESDDEIGMKDDSHVKPESADILDSSKPEKSDKENFKTKALGFSNEELEPISDDDFDLIGENSDDLLNDQPKNISITDALKVDWSSLIRDTRPTATSSTSATKRFSPAAFFTRIGISVALAGPELAGMVKEVIAKEQNEEDVSQSPAKEPFKFLSEVGLLHESAMLAAANRAKLLHDVGPYRRALSARRDLQIRRQLCGLNDELSEPLAENDSLRNVDFYKKNLDLMRNKTAEFGLTPA